MEGEQAPLPAAPRGVCSSTREGGGGCKHSQVTHKHGERYVSCELVISRKSSAPPEQKELTKETNKAVAEISLCLAVLGTCSNAH